MAGTKYYIGNKMTGEEWDCQPKNFDGQLQHVDGIGFSKSFSHKKVDRYFINTHTETAQNVITGEMVFISEELYNRFLDFISADALYLRRVTSDSKTVYADIEIRRFFRNDNNRFRNSFCLCDIDMVAVSPWYKMKSIYEHSQTGMSKTYSYTYPYLYNASDVSVFELDIGARAGAIVNLRIFGAVNAPEWSALSAKGGLISGKFKGTVRKDEYLEINSVASTLGVWLNTATGDRVNAWANCERMLETFIIIPSGHTQIEVLSDGETPDVHCAIEVIEIEDCP